VNRAGTGETPNPHLPITDRVLKDAGSFTSRRAHSHAFDVIGSSKLKVVRTVLTSLLMCHCRLGAQKALS
jgi:hypothetical protein